jgi:hypothetical protein
MLNDPLLILGIIGSVLSLWVFFLNQIGTLSAKNIWYDSINALGALFLLIFAIREEVWPFVITNAVWFSVSFIDVLKWIFKKKLFR